MMQKASPRAGWESSHSSWRQHGSAANIALVIPAWQPDQRLLALVSELHQAGVTRMVVVDDGSALDSQPIFSAVGSLDGVVVLRHRANQGKGRALKSAFSHVLASLPGVIGVVTADADGQHLPEDILRVAQRLASESNRAVLGARSFAGSVPLRSRVGNRLTRRLFALLAGHSVTDTQTGLRGLPMALLPELLALPGERYEYETAMLAHLCQTGGAPAEVPVQTVYMEGNGGSHFNPVGDSLRIYRALFRSALRHRSLGTSKAAAEGEHDEPRWHAA